MWPPTAPTVDGKNRISFLRGPATNSGLARSGVVLSGKPTADIQLFQIARAHVLRVLGASVASERRVVMAVLRGYRQALACAQPA